MSNIHLDARREAERHYVNAAHDRDPNIEQSDRWEELVIMYESDNIEAYATGYVKGSAEKDKVIEGLREEARWRDPVTEPPTDELMRCEVVAADQMFGAWPCWEDEDSPLYWLLDTPVGSEVGDVHIPDVSAWRPAIMPKLPLKG